MNNSAIIFYNDTIKKFKKKLTWFIIKEFDVSILVSGDCDWQGGVGDYFINVIPKRNSCNKAEVNMTNPILTLL